MTGTGARGVTGTLTLPISYSTVPDQIQIAYRGSGATWPPTATATYAGVNVDTPTISNFRIVMFATDAADTLTLNVKYWINYLVIGVR